MIKVLHVTTSLSRLGGGVSTAIWGMTRFQRQFGAAPSIAGIEDQYTQQDTAGLNVRYYAGQLFGPPVLGYSDDLRRHLMEEVERVDVVHDHGLWSLAGMQAGSLARRWKIPRIVTPHGMLEPWALARSPWKKRLAMMLFQHKHLDRAACIHALCESEARNIRCLGFRNPIAIIPNGINVEEYANLPDPTRLHHRFPQLQGQRLVLFLSRIHPKKGLPHLLRAWATLANEFRGWKLVIAGNDEGGHAVEMNKLASELGLHDSVLFTGPAYGEEKRRMFAAAQVFALPSFSEGFSMVILEAAACGLPVLCTPSCNFRELQAAGGSIEVQPDVESTAEGLRKLMSMSDDERREVGAKAKKVVEEGYRWEAVTQRMVDVYWWMVFGGPPPECVHTRDDPVVMFEVGSITAILIAGQVL